MMYGSSGGRNRKFFFFPLIAIAFVAAASGVVMLLWNKVLVDVVSVIKPVSFWQAAGIFLLCKILFGNFKGKGGGPGRFGQQRDWKEKLRNMSDEDREKFRATWKARCMKR